MCLYFTLYHFWLYTLQCHHLLSEKVFFTRHIHKNNKLTNWFQEVVYQQWNRKEDPTGQLVKHFWRKSKRDLFMSSNSASSAAYLSGWILSNHEDLGLAWETSFILMSIIYSSMYLTYLWPSSVSHRLGSHPSKHVLLLVKASSHYTNCKLEAAALTRGPGREGGAETKREKSLCVSCSKQCQPHISQLELLP